MNVKIVSRYITGKFKSHKYAVLSTYYSFNKSLF